MTAPRILSLFSGIGGLDLAVGALLDAGPSWLCEKDPYARRILSRQFPGVPVFGDVLDVGNVGATIVCGGVPCQPASVAGKQRGVCLWENVPGLLSLDDGRAFGGILAAFDAIGYATRWDSAEAAAAGAPHRRDRVFLVCVPVAGFTAPSPAHSTQGVLFGEEAPPEWPRAGWYANGRWGVERPRWPRSSAARNWPTPTHGDERNTRNVTSRSTENPRLGAVGETLCDAVEIDGGKWPTPCVGDADGGRTTSGGKDYPTSLNAAARGLDEAGMWPTPCANVTNLEEEPGTFFARRAVLAERHNNNGAGLPLAIAVKDAYWPTPQAHDQKNAPGAGAAERGGFQSSLAALVLWPTPRAEDSVSRDIADTLTAATREEEGLRLWPTPICNDGDKDGTNTLARVVQCGGPRSRRDGTHRENWPTPKSGDHRSPKVGDATLEANSRPLNEQAWVAAGRPEGSLNPAFSEWLMGLPAGWTVAEGEPLAHDTPGWDGDLVLYRGRPAPRAIPLLTLDKHHRRDRLRCCGNAVNPRQAILAFRALLP